MLRCGGTGKRVCGDMEILEQRVCGAKIMERGCSGMWRCCIWVCGMWRSCVRICLDVEMMYYCILGCGDTGPEGRLCGIPAPRVKGLTAGRFYVDVWR